MKSVSMFWVWFITKTVQPELIIESGIWLGQSTWLLEQAAPNARIIAIDINLERIAYRSPHVMYTTTDFSQLALGDINNMSTLCFFDDHQNAFERLQQARTKGFKHIIFDDNYPPGAGNHLTLAHCLANYPQKARIIDNLCDYFEVLPNIGGTQAHTAEKTCNTDVLKVILPTTLEKLYAADSAAYRWTTYVHIKK